MRSDFYRCHYIFRYNEGLLSLAARDWDKTSLQRNVQLSTTRTYAWTKQHEQFFKPNFNYDKVWKIMESVHHDISEVLLPVTIVV